MKLQFCYYSEKHKDVVRWGAAVDTDQPGRLRFFENVTLPSLMKEGGDLIYFYVIDEPTTDIFTDEWEHLNEPCRCGHSAATHLYSTRACMYETAEASFACGCGAFRKAS